MCAHQRLGNVAGACQIMLDISIDKQLGRVVYG